MSWSFSYSADSKEAALKMLDEKVAECHCPDSVSDIVTNAIDALPDLENADIGVSSYGHFASEGNPGASNMNVSVSQGIRVK